MFGRTLRIGLAALTLTALPAFAYADGNTTQPTPKEHAKEGKGSKAQFPMAADKFKSNVENRIAKSREKLVDRMATKKVAADKQKAVLAKFDEGTTKIMAEVEKACADGTVTKEEAQDIREVTRQVRSQGHKEGKGKEARRDHKTNGNVGRRN